MCIVCGHDDACLLLGVYIVSLFSFVSQQLFPSSIVAFSPALDRAIYMYGGNNKWIGGERKRNKTGFFGVWFLRSSVPVFLVVAAILHRHRAQKERERRRQTKQNKTKKNKRPVLNNWRIGIDSVGFCFCQEVRDYCAILFSAAAGLCMCEPGPCSL